MNALLSARQLSLEPRLHDISLDVERGQVLGLLGINGAGKSTLLAALAGVQPCDSGEILIDGQPLHGQRALRRRVGWLPQRPPIYPDMSVIENLRFAARLRMPGAAVSQAQLDEALQQYQLAPLQRRLAHRLSGGEAMRLGLACCLIHQPDVLLLDEPSAGLDPLQAEQLRALIGALAGERAVVIASHLLPDIEQLCSRALLLHDGRILAEEPVHDARPLMLAEFSHVPEDSALLAIPGIARVVAREAGQVIVELQADAPPIMPEKLACHGWGLRRWQPAPNDLAARFRRISSGEAIS